MSSSKAVQTTSETVQKIIYTPEIRQKIIELSKPIFANGHWYGAYLGKRKIADINKRALDNGEEPVLPKPPKKPIQWGLTEKKSVAAKAARMKMIEENMKKMPQIIADYRKVCLMLLIVCPLFHTLPLFCFILEST
eukprot:Sdes_comp19596_c0_seq3m11323